MLLRYSTLILLLFLLKTNYGQVTQEVEELYRDANSYFYFEDYEEALALYQMVYPHYSENYNLDYRIGFCYLSIHGYRHHAIPFLERAAENTTTRYNEQTIREIEAPTDAMFYLGNAYFINNQLDKAKETYDRFLGSIRRQRQYDMDYFNHQIASVERSRTIQAYPVNFIRSNLGPNINDRFANFNPVISGDGQTMAYTTKRRFYQAIYVVNKENGEWGIPKNITLDLVVDGNCQTLCLSYSGDELYLFKDDDHVGNIYVSNLVGGGWTPMKPLNDNINTEYYETHASISVDGTQLYFASNRSGGYGGLDIYVSERKVGGDWGSAKNLGSTINTRFNENTPFITTDGSTLFFSSEGHNTMGGYDIFFSQRQGRRWGSPINLGHPINTTDDDIFYHPIGSGAVGLMSLFDDQSFGEKDIYQIEIFLPKYQRSIVASHNLHALTSDLPEKTLIIDTLNLPGVALLDPAVPSHDDYLNPNRNYKLFFEGRGYDIRDKGELIKPIDPSITQKARIERPSGLPEDYQHVSYDLISATIDSIIDLPTIDTVASIQPADEVFDEDAAERYVPWLTLPKDTIGKDDHAAVRALTSIMLEFSDEKTRPYLESMLKRSWEMPPSLLMLQASRLARLADSLGFEEQFIGTFAKLIDHVIVKQPDGAGRHIRRIGSQPSDEEFFFWIQKVKRDASPNLSILIENIILNEPTISSFSRLWKHLSKEHEQEVAPYTSEFMNLLARHAFEGFFALTTEQKIAVEESIIKESSYRFPWLLIISIFAGLAAVSIVLHKYFASNKNKSKSKGV